MKKIILITSLFLMIVNSAMAGEIKKDFSEYRYNPFQWVYPEYFYKADTIKINTRRTFSDDYKRIAFFNLSALVLKKYVGEYKQISDQSFGYRVKSEKTGFSISLNDQKFLMCSEQGKEKDFCSAYSSAKEYYHKLYTLTPDMLDGTHSRGDYWMIHAKGTFFEDSRRINIYQGDNFIAYVRTLKDGKQRLKEEIVLFHDDLPPDHYISIGVALSDDNFVTDFLSSLK